MKFEQLLLPPHRLKPSLLRYTRYQALKQREKIKFIGFGGRISNFFLLGGFFFFTHKANRTVAQAHLC